MLLFDLLQSCNPQNVWKCVGNAGKWDHKESLLTIWKPVWGKPCQWKVVSKNGHRRHQLIFDMTESIWNVNASPPEWNTWQVNNSSQIWFWSLCVIVHSDSEGTWFETWLVIQPFYRHNCPLKGNGQTENSHWPGRFRFRTSLAGTASLDDAPPAADGRIPVLDVKLPSTPSISASVGLKGNKVWATRLNRSKHSHYHQTWIST